MECLTARVSNQRAALVGDERRGEFIRSATEAVQHRGPLNNVYGDLCPLGGWPACWKMSGDPQPERGLMTATTNMQRGPQARKPGVGLWPALEAATLIVVNLVATPFIRNRRQRWGTLGTEPSDPLPGDELVPEPRWSYTLGVSIDAPPEAVWPWIAQVGQGRGGFYTYQTLENMAGCEIVNTTEVLTDHQHPEVGDRIKLFDGDPGLRIEMVDAPHALVLLGSPGNMKDEKIWGMSTWQFVIKPTDSGGSRMLTRGRYDHSSDWKSRLMFGRFPLEVIGFVMSRKMMIEIKRLAEVSPTVAV